MLKEIYKSLQELGIPTFHPESLHWRRSYLAEVKSGELVGKEFKTTKGKVFTCKAIDKEHIYFHNIKMDRKYALFLLPTIKQLTTKEQIEFIKNKYPESKFYLSKGCQLHGVVWFILYLGIINNLKLKNK